MWICLQDRVLVDLSKVTWIEVIKILHTEEWLLEFHTSPEKESYGLLYKTEAEAEAEFDRIRFLLSKSHLPPMPIC